jgi:hypothetical protein
MRTGNAGSFPSDEEFIAALAQAQQSLRVAEFRIGRVEQNIRFEAARVRDGKSAFG